jgi:tRNA-specific 2-thiouridylase
LEEYAKGRTPNPDVLCNREIKFGPFLDFAEKIGADYIATGHYCAVSHENGVHKLLKAKDTNKDQTYFLNQLNQHQLEKILFPLGNMIKPDVRKIAEENNLTTAKKKDSTGICFIGERNFRQFLKSYLPAKSGLIKTIDGKVIGKHDGLMYYTIGQRKGLGIGGRKDSNGKPYFVVSKDLKNNVLVVSQGEDDVLFSDYLVAYSVNWIPNIPTQKEFECYAKFRYRQPDQKVRVTIREDGSVRVDFAEKQRAVTVGQYVVFYSETECLGGGQIEEVYKDGKRIQ